MTSPLETDVLARIGPLALTLPVVVSWAVMALLVAGGWLVVRRARAAGVAGRPSPLQAMAELLLEVLDGQISATTGGDPAPYRALIGTLFLFILTCNWLSLVPGVDPPTASLAADAALALIVFAAVIFYALRAGGIRGYLRSFAASGLFMVPLTLLESLTRTVSLLVRLFGNMMSGGFVIAIMLSLAGLLVPIPFMALDLLTGLIQAYIFTTLAMVFIANTAAEARPETPADLPPDLNPDPRKD